MDDDDDDGLFACEINWEKAYLSIYKKGCVYLPSLSRMSASIKSACLSCFQEMKHPFSSHLISSRCRASICQPHHVTHTEPD